MIQKFLVFLSAMKAMILAAGLGTRLKPFTDHHPKALATVNGITLLEHTIRKLQAHGIYDIVVNVHHFANQIIDTLRQNKGFGSNFIISDESEQVLETGGGVLFAQKHLDDGNDFLVVNVDILSNINLQKLIQFHQSQNGLATLAVQKRNSSRQLVFQSQTPELLQLKAWINNSTSETKPENIDIQAFQAFAFSGIQVMRAAIFQHFDGLQGKFSLIDLYLKICQQQTVYGWDHSGDWMLDVGKPESLAKAAQLLS